MRLPIVGGSYEGRSKNINAQRCINFFPVIDQEGGKLPGSLIGTPGFTLFCNIGVAKEVRGAIIAGSYAYFICDDDFYRITAAGVATLKGSIVTTYGHCWLKFNGTQIMIVDGGLTGYIYNTSTDVFVAITDGDFEGASSLDYQDGYFIVSKPATGEFMISASYNGLSWTSTHYATAEGWPDDISSIISDHRELWLFGTETTEIWYNSGVGTPPFDRKIDEILQVGCGAAASPVSHDNTVFWLDNYRRFIRAEGYKPTVVSTRQIEYQWSLYSTVSDAISFSMIHEGHPFCVVTFPTGNATWVLDSSTGIWHERESWFNNVRSRWRANCYVKFGEKHLIGDYANGKIYELDFDAYDEDGEILRASRTMSAVHESRKMIFHNSLEIEFEAGVGLITGQGEDPKAMLDWSDDGGHTWSNEHWTSIGKIGEYKNRARWNKLGRSRERVYRVAISDPVKRVIIDAQLEATGAKS